MRQVVLDTETTGLESSQGHRIIEIGCVEVINRRLTGRHYHQYINPQREVDAGAQDVHGISSEMLSDKPLFAQIVDEFLAFVEGAELVIHNAPFDLGFINAELARLGAAPGRIEERCSVMDSLLLARNKHPGQKNNLDALCKRYGVDNTQRELHGALLDAEILADVYLLMTGGQTALSLGGQDAQGGSDAGQAGHKRRALAIDRPALQVINADLQEQQAHQQRLAQIAKAAGSCLWRDGQGG